MQTTLLKKKKKNTLLYSHSQRSNAEPFTQMAVEGVLGHVFDSKNRCSSIAFGEGVN